MIKCPHMLIEHTPVNYGSMVTAYTTCSCSIGCQHECEDCDGDGNIKEDSMITQEQIEKAICDKFDKLKIDALKKFRLGAIEHGEDWDKIDYELEIEKEIIDIINYSVMQIEVKKRGGENNASI